MSYIMLEFPQKDKEKPKVSNKLLKKYKTKKTID